MRNVSSRLDRTNGAAWRSRHLPPASLAGTLIVSLAFRFLPLSADEAIDPSKLPAPAEKKVDFQADILPLLTTRCHSCHGPRKAVSGLRLSRRVDALAGGDGGQVIVPGKSAASVLIQLVAGLDEDRVMPPEGDRLTAAEVGLLRAWIDQGAPWPDTVDAGAPAGREHWAYQPPVRPAVPEVSRPEWCQTPIDRFVLARLDREGLAPAAELDRARLIRRVSLDLTGLPPTIDEVDAYVNDRDPQAYEKVIDRLLASPAFGERWARMWLDLARYADSRGYEKDTGRTIWRYRDWVIEAFNRNLPFDQFTIEQLAGDMLPNATLDQRIATGFHRNTMNNTEGGTDDEEFRVTAVMDRVETTFGVWMATTFNCCQCHSHKYDPFTQREYYQFFAFLNNTADADRDDEAPAIPAPTPDQAAQADALNAEIAKHEMVLKAETPELTAAQLAWEQAQGAQLAKWAPLEVESAIAASGAMLATQEDRSLLASGDPPDVETFTLVARTELKQITALRIEALPHDSLPNKGPGRAPNGNFVLTELQVTTGGANDQPAQYVSLTNGSADHEQGGFPIGNAVDGDAKTGWAIDPHMGKPHVAVFEFREPLSFEDAGRLTLVLGQNYGGRHTLGRVRISVTSLPAPVRVETLPETVRTILAVAAADRDEAQRAELGAYFRSITPLLKPVRDTIAQLRESLPKIATTLVMQELPQPRETRMLIRGSFLNKGDAVEPGVPAVLNPFSAELPRDRLGAARWLVSRENPLTARVTVNRFWEQIFGRGVVETSEDFGTRGERPSHPELLDWLAVELMEPSVLPGNGNFAVDRAPASARPWDMKRFLKLIVMSAVYRQSPHVSADLAERDPHNRLLARGPRFRMEAEMLRDQALAVSGLLSAKRGGPSVMPPQPDGIWLIPYSGEKWVTSAGEDKYRRALYTFWRRSAPYPAFMTFDAPSREVCVIRRPRSNTPLQALTILNDPVTVEASQALARRAMELPGAGPAERATHIFRRCLARTPTPVELERLRALFNKELEQYRQDATAARDLATSQLGPAPEGVDLAELAAWTVVGNVVLNLDETLSK